MALVIRIIFFVGIGLVCRLWLGRGRNMGRIEPRCAACAYIVHGLPGPICPECGADLRRPKAVVTRRRLPPGRPVRSVAWSVFCLSAVAVPLAIICDTFAASLIPAMPA